MEIETTTARNVMYYPPPSEKIDQFAREACTQLGDEFADPEIYRGFAHFVKALAKAYTNHLNRETEQTFDKYETSE